MPDPDRFIRFDTPGAQEWWYFDALSDDGRDALVLVWYAGLPFDPQYGVGAIRHLRDPRKHPAPSALDHCAIGVSWHRDGRLMAYALNAFRRHAFGHRPHPFRLDVAGNVLDRPGHDYALAIDTPAVDGRRRIVAGLAFRPATRTRPIEFNLGTPEAPHVWVLAAADCRVEGSLAIGDRSLDFSGRGYHDHNAGAEEISRAIRRWEWGRVHRGTATEIYYRSRAHSGEVHSLHVTCEDGDPASAREGVAVRDEGMSRNIFGVRSAKVLHVGQDPDGLACAPTVCLDDGPFYRRWLAEFATAGGPVSRGICEILDTKRLNHPLFNWMIPYRLKRPAESLSRHGAGSRRER